MLSCDVLCCVVLVFVFAFVGLPFSAVLLGVMLYRTQLHQAPHKQTRYRVRQFAFRPVIYKYVTEAGSLEP